jgi:diacylglycerol kinase (ATP)
MTLPPAPLAIIANPAAGRGRGARMVRRLQDALGSHVPHRLQLTRAPGDERRLAELAARGGAETILALGGDGTWGNVVRGIMASGASPRLALLAAGTGNDLAFATRVPAHDLDATLAIAQGRAERRIDVGEVDGVHFVNCAGFGFDAEVLRGTQEVPWLRGHAVYLVTALRKLLGYRGFSAALQLPDDVRPRSGTGEGAGARAHHLAVVVSNGARFGGGFVIAPGATVDDGTFDVVRIADGTPWRRAVVFAGATRGTHLRAPEVSHWRAPSVQLHFDAPPLFDADGELHQARSAVLTVVCHPAALRIAVAAAASPAGVA